MQKGCAHMLTLALDEKGLFWLEKKAEEMFPYPTNATQT